MKWYNSIYYVALSNYPFQDTKELEQAVLSDLVISPVSQCVLFTARHCNYQSFISLFFYLVQNHYKYSALREDQKASCSPNYKISSLIYIL